MKRLFEISIILVFATLVLLPKWVTISSILLVVMFIIKAIKEKSRFQWDWTLMLMPLFYLLYLIGLVNTTDFDYAGMDLGSKISLVIFPIVFSFNPKVDMKLVVKGMMYVAMASMLFGLIESVFIYVKDSTLYWRAFTGSYLAFKMHTTYLSWILNFSLVLLLVSKINQSNIFNKKLDRLLIVTLVLYILLLKSFAGIILIFLTMALFIGYWTWRKYGRLKTVYAFSALLLLVITLILLPPVQNEFGKGLGDVNELFIDKPAYFEKNKNNVQSTKARTLLWTVAIEKIRENPLGYGTGDGKGEFVNACIEEDLEVGRKGLNPHNQFFQTSLAIGVFGGVFLMFLFLKIKNVAWRKRSIPLLFVSMSVAFHCLFESLLEKQSGIVFFTLIVSILLAQLVFEKHKKEV